MPRVTTPAAPDSAKHCKTAQNPTIILQSVGHAPLGFSAERQYFHTSTKGIRAETWGRWGGGTGRGVPALRRAVAAARDGVRSRACRIQVDRSITLRGVCLVPRRATRGYRRDRCVGAVKDNTQNTRM